MRRKERRRGAAPRHATKAESPGDARPEAERTIDLWEGQLLEVLVQAPAWASRIVRTIRAEELQSPAARDVFIRAATLEATGIEPTFERLMLEFDAPHQKSFLVDLDERGRGRKIADMEAHLEALLESFRRRREDRQRRLRAQSLRQQGLDEGEQLRALQEIIETRRNREGISAPTEG
jgi:hypothetical protein